MTSAPKNVFSVVLEEKCGSRWFGLGALLVYGFFIVKINFFKFLKSLNLSNEIKKLQIFSKISKLVILTLI